MQFKTIGSALGAAAISVIISAALSNTAVAQTNVTIYGIIDSGLEVINSAGADSAHSNTLERISSGNLSGSRMGFRGNEDLGGGQQAVFTLEMGIGVDTGTSLQSNRTFGRQAFVGLQGPWGSLLLGRQNSLQLDWMSKYNTMDNATWSSKVQDASFSDRLDNSIKYTVKVAPPVEISTYYSTGFDATLGGEVAGSFKAGREMGIGTQYTGGSLRLAAVYDQKNGQTAVLAANTDKHLTFGARYKFGDVEIMGGVLFRKQDNIGAPTIRTNMYWFGGSYQVTGPFQISASIYQTDLKNTEQDPTSFITLLKYSLSQRTDLYLINSYAINRGGSNLGVNGFASSIAPGHNQFGTMAGVRHTF